MGPTKAFQYPPHAFLKVESGEVDTFDAALSCEPITEVDSEGNTVILDLLVVGLWIRVEIRSSQDMKRKHERGSDLTPG